MFLSSSALITHLSTHGADSCLNLLEARQLNDQQTKCKRRRRQIKHDYKMNGKIKSNKKTTEMRKLKVRIVRKGQD